MNWRENLIVNSEQNSLCLWAQNTCVWPAPSWCGDERCSHTERRRGTPVLVEKTSLRSTDLVAIATNSEFKLSVFVKDISQSFPAIQGQETRFSLT